MACKMMKFKLDIDYIACHMIQYKIVLLHMVYKTIRFKLYTGHMSYHMIQYKIILLRIACDSV